MTKKKPLAPGRLDARDQQIIAHMRENAWLSYAGLARRINLSASAAQRRVERLKEAGIILGARAIIAASASPPWLRIFVLVELRDEGKAYLEAFAKRVCAHPMVIAADYVTGEADIVLTLRAESMEHYTAFANEHLVDNSNVRRFKTLTVMRALIG